MSWWVWTLIGWTGVALVLAVTVGLSIRTADRRERERALAAPVAAPAAPVADLPPPRRRRVPVPPVAVTVALAGIGLEAVGFVLRATGQEQGSARLLSMDAPGSVPRLFVAGLFVAAAAAALVFGARTTHRRAWWVAVGLVAVAVAEVKAGGTVHVRALEALGVADHPLLAAAGSLVLTVAVLGALWWLSRTDRRDRRRVLLAFALYAVAAVGLSAVSSLVAEHAGGTWFALATFVEESGEVVGGVAVLLAVLVGVAPRLVLPADWALRRTADAETIDVAAVPPLWGAGCPTTRG